MSQRKKRWSVRDTPDKAETSPKGSTILVAVDFSHCSTIALRKGKSLTATGSRRLVVLHVIDQHFMHQCIREHIGNETEIKKRLFPRAKARLREYLRKEGIDENSTEMIVCEGIPCIEINKKAVECDAEMIIMGSKGNSDDMKSIFFGSTTERVLRFISRPVLCVPPEGSHNLKQDLP